MCDRWHKLPSEVLDEPAESLRFLLIAQLGKGVNPGVEPG